MLSLLVSTYGNALGGGLNGSCKYTCAAALSDVSTGGKGKKR